MVALASEPSGSLYAATRGGRVLRIAEGGVDEQPATDLTGSIAPGGSGDSGIMGMALHPRFRENGRLMLAYQRGGSDDAFVVEERLLEDGARDVPSAARVVLAQPDREPGHPGGALVFGSDGYLYAGLGDGGGHDDVTGNIGHAQDPESLLGKLLRLDVESDPARPAPDNPWIQAGGRPETWALGCRDPRSAALDGETGELLLLDVGVSADLLFALRESTGATNLGWRAFDGFDEHDPELARMLRAHEPPAFVIERAGSRDAQADCRLAGAAVMHGTAEAGYERLIVMGQRCSSDYIGARLSAGHPIGPCRIPGVLDEGEGTSAMTLLPDGAIGAATTAGRLLRIVPGTSQGTSWTRPVDDVVPPDVAPAPPRPLAPPSGMRVGASVVELRWELPEGLDGARVDLCQDRGCTRLVASLDVEGSSTLTPELPPGPVFWRLTGLGAGDVTTPPSAVWQIWPGRRVSGSAATWRPVLDMDGDGRGDLVVATGNNTRDAVLWYRGGPTLGRTAPAGTLITADPGWDIVWVGATSAGDLDGDGYADVVAGWSSAFPSLSVYRGGSTPSAEAIVRYSGDAPTTGIRGFGAAGDVDGDGYTDLLLGAPYGGASVPSSGLDPTGALYLFRGGAPGPAAVPSAGLSAPAALGDALGSRVAMCDVDGDAHADVLGSTSRYATSVLGYLYRGSSEGPETTASLVLTTSGPPDHVKTLRCDGDVDGDGYPDVVVGTQLQAEIFAGGPSGPSERADWVIPFTHLSGEPQLCDLNDDGFDDLLVARPSTETSPLGTLELYPGGPSGPAFTPADTYLDDRPDDYLGGSIACGDLDADGRDELIVGTTTRILVVSSSDDGRLSIREEIVPPMPSASFSYGVAM
ncbi:MAG: FG-GAP repeat protein [Deltaproteobacteria bacterium]|nr:FG-GAP repeat protein [Deltaproteobacteria bacterium]